MNELKEEWKIIETEHFVSRHNRDTRYFWYKIREGVDFGEVKYLTRGKIVRDNNQYYIIQKWERL